MPDEGHKPLGDIPNPGQQGATQGNSAAETPEEQDARERADFLAGEFYQKHIKPFLNQPASLVDKLIFVSECYRLSMKLRPSHVKILREDSPTYLKDFAVGIEEELNSLIKTPQDLDSFLGELISKTKLNWEQGLFGNNHETFNSYIGHIMGHGIIDLIVKLYLKPHSKKESTTDADLDWLYAIMKHFHNWTEALFYVMPNYKRNIDNHKSIALKEYLLSQGININEYMGYAKYYL